MYALLGRSSPELNSDASVRPTEELSPSNDVRLKVDSNDSQQPSTAVDLDDPAKEGWETEVFAELAKKQLKQILQMLSVPDEVTASHCADMVTEGFSGASFVPAQLKVVYRDDTFQIERSASNKGEQSEPKVGVAKPTGAEHFANALRPWAETFQHAEQFRFEVKVTGVRFEGKGATTTQSISVAANFASYRLEQHAKWETTWQRSGPKQSPLITSLRVKEFEQATTRSQQGSLLADCTQSVIGHNPCFSSQVLRGYGSHLERVQDGRYTSTWWSDPGMAIGDVNGDGLDDLYVCQEEGLPNLLFVQQPDGTANECAAQWGVDWLHQSRGALLVDLNNTGRQDLAVAVLGGVIIASNEGSRFTDRAFLPTSNDTMSLAAADFDLDGYLDLYVTCYEKLSDSSDSLSQPVVAGFGNGFSYHDATTGGKNSLYRNVGNWTFNDVTQALGLDVENRRFSFAASWEDFDNDGDMDLYVANDFGPNHLFRNDHVPSAAPDQGQQPRRTFHDVAHLLGADDRASSMSIVWGDYDRNGWMDLYIGNMYSSAGNRITTQPQFRQNASADVRSALVRFARGNTLLQNSGEGSFVDVSRESGAAMGRWAWSSILADVNNDGWEDVLVANGNITGTDERDL